MIPALIVFFLFTGWGVFGYVMYRLDSFYFCEFPAPMIALMAFFGFIMGLGVYSVTKLLGFS